MKILKRLFLFVLLLIALVIGIAFFIGKFYGEEIKAFVVTNLNKNLKTDVAVKTIDFSVWESFPNASVVFHNTVIYAVNSKNDTLLAAEKLSVQFNLIDLYHKNYKLTGLGIENGLCQMQNDSEGNPNYIFWNESDSTSESFSIELEKVNISNMEFFYLDYSSEVAIGFLIDDLKLKGNFSDAIFTMNLDGNLEHTNIRVDHSDIVTERNFKLEVKGNVDQNKELLNFENAKVSVDNMDINVMGKLFYGAESKIDIQLASGNTDLEKAIALLPYNLRQQLIRFDIEGQATFKGNVTGPINSTRSPAYKFDFSITDGLFKDKESDLKFSKTLLNGSIHNGSSNTLETTSLHLDQFVTELKKSKISGLLHLENFNNPDYYFKGKLGFELKEAVDFLQLKEVLNAAGSIQADLEIKGRMGSINSYTLNDWKRATVIGALSLNELGLKYANHPQLISEGTGKLTFNNNSLAVENLHVKVDRNVLSIDGKFNNLIGYFIDEREELFVDASLYSSSIYLEDFLRTEPADKTADTSYQLNISPRITFYLDTKIDHLNFNQFDLKNLVGDLVVKNSSIDARGISFESQEGVFRGDFFVREKGNDLTIASIADLQNIDIKKTFKSFGNFGQSTLKSEHISGIANAHVNFSSIWNKNLEVDPKSITADIVFNIDKGRLTDFQPLEALSKFIELEELRDVKFQQLQNQILIKESTITIPRFDISSSAINLSLAGTHTFENIINYRITLLLSEILGRKAKKSKSYKQANSEFGYVEDDGLGRTKLFLKMTGTTENPDIAYDSKELKKSIQEKFSTEKNTFKSLMKEEFGLFKKDSTVKTLPKKEKQNSPFTIELDSSFSKNKPADNKEDIPSTEKEKQNKSKFGKFLDKIAKPNEEEFVEPAEN